MEHLNAQELWLMGARFQMEGKLAEAMTCYEQALGKDPRLALAWEGKGNVLRKLNRREEAIGCFERALELDPSLATSWAGKGHALIELGRREEARECFRRATDIEPKMTEMFRKLGLL